MVSEATVLPPSPAPQHSKPTPPQQSSSRSSLYQRATPRPQTSKTQQFSSVGFQGVPDPQRAACQSTLMSK